MNKITKKIFVFLLSVLTLFSMAFTAFAVDWSDLNSSSIKGNGNASAAYNANFTIPNTNARIFVGVRCSVVDSGGNTKGDIKNLFA